MHFNRLFCILGCVCILHIQGWPNIIEYSCEIRRVILLRKSLLVVLTKDLKQQGPTGHHGLGRMPSSASWTWVQLKLNSEKCIFIIMIFSCNQMNYHYIQGGAGENCIQNTDLIHLGFPPPAGLFILIWRPFSTCREAIHFRFDFTIQNTFDKVAFFSSIFY